MGDDLTAARRFCDTVRSDMSSLMEGVCAQPCAAQDVLVGSLDRIQSGAKRIHARAIFRAAQTVVNAVNDRSPLPTVQGRVLSLNKIISQYEIGLEDIAPRAANLGGDFQGSAPSLAQPQTEQTTTEFSIAPPPMPDVEARFTAARAALAPLMHFAKPGREHAGLVKLAEFSKTELQPATAPDTAGIMMEELCDLGPAAPVQTQTPAASSPPRKELQKELLADFEMLMPAFVSGALGEARQTDKTVSVSYAAEGVSVAQKQLPALQSVFDHIAKTLVRSVLERPETRRARGESGAGHIAVTATQTSETVMVSIECRGRALAVSAFMPPDDKRAEGLIITPGQNGEEGDAHKAGLVHIVLTVPRKTPAAHTASALRLIPAEIAS